MAASAQSSLAAPAVESRVGGERIARDVWMLVPRITPDLELAHADLAFTFLQMPLNHIGLRLVERAVDDGAPPDADPTQVRAIGTWLQAEDELPDWFWPWFERQDRSLRVLHLGSLQPLARADGGASLARHLERLGLAYDARVVAEPGVISVAMPRPDVYPFESRPVYERVHLGPWSTDVDNRAWVVTHDTRSPARRRTPVVTGRWGGIGLQPWLLRLGGEDLDRRWYADPFAFCREALGVDGMPAPDPSVLHGRRMFVLHVDGDGFESASTVARGANCGEVFRDRVVDRWRIPMTVSYVVASLTKRLDAAGGDPRIDVARAINERPWVEIASHSVLHPLDWRRSRNPRSVPRSVVWYEDLPGFDHDMVAEVRESIAFVDRWLAPPGKRCRMMFWSGAANPPPAAIRAARLAGCGNLNGGLFRWDALHDSVGFVTPWGREIGGEWQVFAAASNENAFDGFFTDMPGAFAHTSTTIERTGGARILKPANVYCHFYSAERPARLAALERLLQRWVRDEATIPVFASRYAAAVEDAQYRCALRRTERGFVFRGFESCRTVRIEGRRDHVDWPNCRGLLGARRLGDRLFLDLAAPEAEVAFAPGPAAPWLHVEQSDREVELRGMHGTALHVTVRGCGDRLLVLAGGPPAGALRVAVDGRESTRRCDASGRCEVRITGEGASEVSVWLP